MNKKLLSVAVVAAMALPMTANAGAAKAYGAVHVALQSVTVGDADAVWDIDGTSSKATKMGVKGSTDTNLMDFKAVYQIEMGLNQQSDSFYQRDTWVGLSSKSMGTVRGGTIKTGWKSTSIMVDPLFTTALEGRGGVVGGASGQLAGGKGTGRGRSTHTVRYDSPSFGGVKLVANYAFDAGKDNIGAGVVYKTGGISAFANYQTSGEDLSAMKVGGKFSSGAIGISGAYEIDGGAISQNKDGEQNKLYLAGTYTMGATTLIVNFGSSAETTSGAANDSTGFGLAVSQKVAKKVSIYGGYGQSSGGDNYTDMSALAIGMNAKF